MIYKENLEHLKEMKLNSCFNFFINLKLTRDFVFVVEKLRHKIIESEENISIQRIGSC